MDSLPGSVNTRLEVSYKLFQSQLCTVTLKELTSPSLLGKKSNHFLGVAEK